MAKRVARGEEAIARMRAKERLQKVELRIWYERNRLRKRIIRVS